MTKSVQGLLFVASLIDYNRVLYEDASVNAMWECCKLFEEVIHLKWFDNCELILILNKDDLLKELLLEKENGLSKCFSKNGLWPENNDDYREQMKNNRNNISDNNSDKKKNDGDYKDDIKMRYEIWDTKYDDKYWPLISSMTSIHSKNKYFSSYHSKVINFLTKLFLHRQRANKEGIKRQIHRHITVATENTIVGDVFQTIQYTIVTGNIDDLGFAKIAPNMIRVSNKSEST